MVCPSTLCSTEEGSCPKKSTLSVGLIGMVDPAAPFPAIPIITYSHRFNPDLELAIEPSLAGREAELVAPLGLGDRIAVVSDANTHPILGQRVERALEGRAKVTSIVTIQDVEALAKEIA